MRALCVVLLCCWRWPFLNQTVANTTWTVEVGTHTRWCNNPLTFYSQRWLPYTHAAFPNLCPVNSFGHVATWSTQLSHSPKSAETSNPWHISYLLYIARQLARPRTQSARDEIGRCVCCNTQYIAHVMYVTGIPNWILPLAVNTWWSSYVLCIVQLGWLDIRPLSKSGSFVEYDSNERTCLFQCQYATPVMWCLLEVMALWLLITDQVIGLKQLLPTVGEINNLG